MAFPLAVFSDVASRSRGTITEADLDDIEVLIDDASILVRAEFPDIDARIASGALDPQSVAMVVGEMVRIGFASAADNVKSDSAGPFAVTYDNPTGSVYLKAAHRLILGGGAVPRARSVRMGY